MIAMKICFQQGTKKLFIHVNDEKANYWCCKLSVKGYLKKWFGC